MRIEKLPWDLSVFCSERCAADVTEAGPARQLPVSCVFITFLVLKIYVSTMHISDSQLVLSSCLLWIWKCWVESLWKIHCHTHSRSEGKYEKHTVLLTPASRHRVSMTVYFSYSHLSLNQVEALEHHSACEKNCHKPTNKTKQNKTPLVGVVL